MSSSCAWHSKCIAALCNWGTRIALRRGADQSPPAIRQQRATFSRAPLVPKWTQTSSHLLAAAIASQQVRS